MSENTKPTSVESWVLLRQIKRAIFKTCMISVSTHLKLDRRFEVNLHVEAARELFCGLCDEMGVDQEDAVDEICATPEIYEYRLQQFCRYVEAYEYGDRTPKVVAFNRRLWTIRRSIENIQNGY